MDFMSAAHKKKLPKAMAWKKVKWNNLTSVFTYFHTHVATLNSSKFFAGLMIITLNIASKFVTFRLSKTMEAYLKFTFSRLILVFAIAWVGTRDIYTALVICLLFTICMDFLFNEESQFCCLPSAFTDYHVGLLEGMDTQSGVSKIDEAIQVLEQIKKEQSSATPKP
jgi:hypothetical protein